jgi:hypothetical protein
MYTTMYSHHSITFLNSDKNTLLRFCTVTLPSRDEEAL